MKKMFLITAVLLSVITLSAQDKTAKEFKAEGIDAYKAKDYSTAFTSFEKALEINITENVVDTPLHYNTGYCAYKSKNYDVATKYFKKAIEFGYKKEKAYLFTANSYKKSKNLEEYGNMLDIALVEYPDNAKLKKMQATRFFRDGLVHYNKASESIQEAARIVESNPDKFKVKKAEAEKEYAAALPLLKEAYVLFPKIKNLPEAIIGVYEGLGMKAEAEEFKNELEEK